MGTPIWGAYHMRDYAPATHPKAHRPEGAPAEGTGEDIKEVDALRCEACGELCLGADADPAPLYECGECGTVFNRDNGGGRGWSCPDCNKFAAKVGLVSCPNCSEGPLESVKAFMREDSDELYETEEDAS